MAHMRLARHLAAIGTGAVAILALAGTAQAEPPITGTDHSTFTDSFTDPFPCRDELYTFTDNVDALVHFTFFEETGAFHFHEVLRGTTVAVPLDGTGPTYRANFMASDSENIRAVRHGDVLVETDTDHFIAIAHGSDGSMLRQTFLAHFTINANGETTVQLERVREVCS